MSEKEAGIIEELGTPAEMGRKMLLEPKKRGKVKVKKVGGKKKPTKKELLIESARNCRKMTEFVKRTAVDDLPGVVVDCGEVGNDSTEGGSMREPNLKANKQTYCDRKTSEREKFVHEILGPRRFGKDILCVMPPTCNTKTINVSVACQDQDKEWGQVTKEQVQEVPQEQYKHNNKTENQMEQANITTMEKYINNRYNSLTQSTGYLIGLEPGVSGQVCDGPAGKGEGHHDGAGQEVVSGAICQDNDMTIDYD